MFWVYVASVELSDCLGIRFDRLRGGEEDFLGRVLGRHWSAMTDSASATMEPTLATPLSAAGLSGVFSIDGDPIFDPSDVSE